MVMGDTQLTPFDMGTFGSRTTPTMNLQLRKVAAAAREMLIGLAAAQWKIDRQRWSPPMARMTDPQTKRSAGIRSADEGTAAHCRLLPRRSPDSRSRVEGCGKSAPKVDGRDFVTGKHRYPSDQKLPECCTARCCGRRRLARRCCRWTRSKAEQMACDRGARRQFCRRRRRRARRRRAARAAAIHAEWKSDRSLRIKNLFEYLKKNAGEGQRSHRRRRSLRRGQRGAGAGFRRSPPAADLHGSYIAHVPLEPRAALAKWDGDKLTVWTGTQRPFGVRGRIGRGVSHSRRSRARADAGHGIGLWRQAHRRNGD